MKTDLFQSCGHCWVFQILWHIECSTFAASCFRIWNSSTGIPSPPLALFIVMLLKAHLTSHSRMSDSRCVIIPSWLSWSWRSFYVFILFYFTVLYWFCHTLIWIHHGCTRVPNPEPPSHLPPHTISLGHPGAPAPSILYPASSLDWWFISYMILYMFQCHSPKSSHPLPLPQSPKDCSIHLCLFCCLAYRVIVTIFLNSIYMC